MRFIAIMLIALACCSCRRAYADSYPSDWPELVRASSTCIEISGSYVDQNTWRWKHVDAEKNSKTGSTREAAWATFGVIDGSARPNDPAVKSRTFSIAFDVDQNLLFNYIIDGKAVMFKRFTPEDYTCTKEGLHLTSLEKHGQVMDKLPNLGVSTRNLLISRNGEYLYVLETNKTRAWTLYFIPTRHSSIRWTRFLALQP